VGFSFESVNALDYDRLRPDYAPEAVRWVADRAALGAGALVVDLAAGTGQLARRFAKMGVGVLAVEPASNMRAILEANLPGVQAVSGLAEQIPLEDARADAVVVGNAFHHFDPERSVGELRRVLRAGGALALFWARAEEPEGPIAPIMREVEAAAVERARASSAIVRAYRSWIEPPERIVGFTPFEIRSFPTTHALPSSRLADLFATSSDVASLAPADREDLLERIRRLAATLPPTLELPARSEVQLCFRT
jgi:ubiquinone/menaquinone biosynthesis C-methylase UbiE